MPNPNNNDNHIPSKTASRLLLAAVIIMGIMLIVGSITLVWIITKRALNLQHTQNHTLSSTVVTSTPKEFSRLELPLQDDEHIQHIIPRPDGTIIVSLKGSHKERILIWSPEIGHLQSELDFN